MIGGRGSQPMMWVHQNYAKYVQKLQKFSCFVPKMFFPRWGWGTGGPSPFLMEGGVQKSGWMGDQGKPCIRKISSPPQRKYEIQDPLVVDFRTWAPPRRYRNRGGGYINTKGPGFSLWRLLMGGFA